MIDFKQIEIDDIENFKQYYDYTSALGCDNNLLNSYLWRDEYNIKFAVINDTLIKAYFNNDGSIYGYCMPTGKDVRFAIDVILNDAQSRNTMPVFVMLTTAQRAVLESTYPSKYKYVRSPENQDYIYFTKDLALLQGKKFHSKRNHISKFYKTYNFTHFETIDETNKKDAYKVALKWCEQNNIKTENYQELKAIKESLDNLEKFNMRGGIIYLDNDPIAMTLGSEISSLIFDINFEKALREYDGIYAVINNEFAKLLANYKYINREEDMGLEGLRKSKMSYNPEIILDRFNAYPV